MTFVPNTGSSIDRGLSNPNEGRTTSGLSTQIVIKVGNQAVGALQSLSVTQNRPLKRVDEIGTDGNIEIVPQGSTTFDLAATRIVFDNLRLPEAFGRSFRFINAQRIPFDIEIFDLSNAIKQDFETNEIASDSVGNGVVVHRFVNCWFQNYATPFQTSDFTIAETATIWAETGYVSSGTTVASSLRATDTENNTIERRTNTGGRRGGVDSSGILNAIFQS